MLKLKSFLSITFIFSCLVLTNSCSENENNSIDALEITENDINDIQPDMQTSTGSPFSFNSKFDGDDFQVDNDGNGAHNWNTKEYEDEPIDNGFDVRDFIHVNNNRLILECPEGEEGVKRRAEYRDQVNIDLNDAHSIDLTFDTTNYNNNSELIMTQLHNDNSAARRPYITILAENGIVRLQRTNAPTGSSSLVASQTIPFRTGDRYRVRIESGRENGDRSVFASIINLDTDEQVNNTFDFDNDWNDLDGDFYWKFGAYMPDGGSDGTQMRVETISIIGQ